MIKLLGKFLTWLYWKIVLIDRWLQDEIDWKANYLTKKRELKMKKIKEWWQDIGFGFILIVENLRGWWLKYFNDDPLYGG